MSPTRAAPRGFWPALAVFLPCAAAGTVSLVEASPGSYVLRAGSGDLGVNGTVRGFGGHYFLDKARAAGADAVRTWALEDLVEGLPGAEARGLWVSAGIWLTHSASRYVECSDLSADATWQAELATYVEGVRRYKDSGALLWWTVGNEVELEVDIQAGNDCIWKRIEWVAQAVKAEDPDHPVGTVLAGFQAPKVISIRDMCPTIEFLGMNSYAQESFNVGSELLRVNWTKPFAFTEFGPRGHWSVPRTDWGTFLEQSSTEKVCTYELTHERCVGDGRCVGSFPFLLGWKWEVTGTWYGLLNTWAEVTEGCPEEGCEVEPLAKMKELFTGLAPAVPPPSIQSVALDGHLLAMPAFVVEWGELARFQVVPRSNDGTLTALWAVTAEDRDTDSNREGAPDVPAAPLISGIWWGKPATAATAVGMWVVMNSTHLDPNVPYRLYLFLRDTHGQESSASFAFNLCDKRVHVVCMDRVARAMDTDIHEDPDLFAAEGLTPSSSFADFRAFFFRRNEAHCTLPCSVKTCHTAVVGELCFNNMLWAKNDPGGIENNPQWFPCLTPASSLLEFQASLVWGNDLQCQIPCPVNWLPEAEVPVDEIVTITQTFTMTITTTPCCCIAEAGSECAGAVEWARSTGIWENPANYEGLTGGDSTWNDFQEWMFLRGFSGCLDPCVDPSNYTTRSTTMSTLSETDTTRTGLCCCLAPEGSMCYNNSLYIQQEGINRWPTAYPGVNASSTLQDIQDYLYRSGDYPEAECYDPCNEMTTTETSTTTDSCCCVAQSGEKCYDDITWARNVGYYQDASRYPGVLGNSSYKAWQEVLFLEGLGDCVHPCIETTVTTTPECCCIADVNSTCRQGIRWVLTQGIYEAPANYPNLTNESSVIEVQDLLSRNGMSECLDPCNPPTSTTSTTTHECCCVAFDESPCRTAVLWAMSTGIFNEQAPVWFPGLNESSNFTDFQEFFYNTSQHFCDHPCIPTTTTATTTEGCCCYALEGTPCYAAIVYGMDVGIHATPQYYTNLTNASNETDFQIFFYETSQHDCVHPCETTTTTTPCCCIATEGSCHAAVVDAKTQRIFSNPEWYPQLTPESSFELFQEHLFNQGHAGCPHPCEPVTTPNPCPFIAEAGTPCFAAIEWVLRDGGGIDSEPSWYPTLSKNSSFIDVQTVVAASSSPGGCIDPCNEVTSLASPSGAGAWALLGGVVLHAAWGLLA